MKIVHKTVEKNELRPLMRSALDSKLIRFGLINAVDSNELISLMLDISNGSFEIWTTNLDNSDSYPSVSLTIPQAHWFERRLQDTFGIVASGHPRLKSTFAPTNRQLNFPLLNPGYSGSIERNTSFLEVEGDGVYELPVGPVHAGIIEPGHFRLSCLGEEIQNLELRFGYLHRGIEKRLTEIDWKMTRFLSEAAASDCPVANALANAIALESLLEIEVDEDTNLLRTLALEIERIAMHIFDISGMAYDIGFTAIAATLGRLRGTSLKMAELLSGSRLMRGLICPAGILPNKNIDFDSLKKLAVLLEEELNLAFDTFLNDTSCEERLEGTGIVSKQMALDFGMVGIIARASGISYDTRTIFKQGCYPQITPKVIGENGGDALSRTKTRIGEVSSSFEVVKLLLESASEPASPPALPKNLPADKKSIAVVESFRGELIHLIATDDNGRIKRYIIKDPSNNNWTGMAIAARDESIADFPICNKSFGLSYSGHDL